MEELQTPEKEREYWDSHIRAAKEQGMYVEEQLVLKDKSELSGKNQISSRDTSGLEQQLSECTSRVVRLNKNISMQQKELKELTLILEQAESF